WPAARPPAARLLGQPFAPRGGRRPSRHLPGLPRRCRRRGEGACGRSGTCAYRLAPGMPARAAHVPVGALRRLSAFLVAVADAVERLELREVLIDLPELLAQALDVAVDGAVVDIDALAIGLVHQLVAVLDVAGADGERLKQQELGDRQ